VGRVDQFQLYGVSIMTHDMSFDELTLTDVFRHAVDGMFIVHRDRRVAYFSEGCERITGAASSNVVGADCACHRLADCQDTHGHPLSAALCPAMQILNGAATNARHQISARDRDGRRVWIETTYSPVKDERGEVKAVACIMRDITESKDSDQTGRQSGQIDTPGAIVTGESSAPAGGPLDRMLTAIERKEILTALDRADGQRTLAARSLGISRSRLYRRMEALRIDPREVNPSS